ncbi:MAG: hypothetical protein DSY80_03115 [Desulfocapsa sp.]|nr:MAG: hypothetical protein DSY80_03115 [Desulfocapsa sp.]
MEISRNPKKAEESEYDVIVIGGGIYGVTLALEAGRRGLKTLILEKGDFGEQTSFNSLKIIHGGLRYLQSLDLPRFKESVSERSWFLRHFPGRVYPLPCYMPLYGNGMRKPSIFRAALFANHLLALNRNKGIQQDHHLPMGEVVDVRKSQEIFPLVDSHGLKGGAVWYDAYMPDSQLLLMDLLQAACHFGTTPLNYIKANSLLLDKQGNIEGVACKDCETGDNRKYHAPIVINAAGSWCREIINGVAGDKEELFRLSLAWNVLFDREALSDHALAVQARKSGSRLFFITPWKGKIFAGTGHEPWSKGPGRPMPTMEQLASFIESLNEAVPGMELEVKDVARIFAGFLPTTELGSSKLTKREVIVDHGLAGGPTGLYSVGGIKFTTARLVAEKILGLAAKGNAVAPMPGMDHYSYQECKKRDDLEEYRSILSRDKSIVHLDDLLLRRSTLWETGAESLQFAEKLCDLFPWNEEQKKQELAKCSKCLEPFPQKTKFYELSGEHHT